jgi:hypothetical protein
MRPLAAAPLVLLVGCGEPTAPTPAPPASLEPGLEVVASAPVAGAVGVARAATVTLEFSLPVNPATVNDGTVTLWREADRVPVSLSTSGATTLLVPRELLALNTTYVVTATRAVQDTAGRPMVREFRLVFTTKMNGVP